MNSERLKPVVCFRVSISRLAAIAFFVAAGVAVFGAPSLDPKAEVEAFARLDSPLSVADLAEISLAFSGVPQSGRSSYTNYIGQLISEASAYLEDETDAYSIGDRLLSFLHDRLFVRYVESQTAIDELLDSGSYNCVSSAVVYFIFATHFGIEVGATVTSDHALCTVYIDGAFVDVETTTPHGFDPGNKKEFFDSFGNLTGYSYVPPANYRTRNTKDGRELLALILHNRISEMDSAGRFDDALALALDRHAFLSSEQSYADVIRELSNYLAALNGAGSYVEALELIGNAFRRFGRIDKLVSLQEALLYNRIVLLVRDSRFDEARVFLGSLVEGESITSEKKSELDVMILQHDLAQTLPALSVEEGFEYLRSTVERSNARVDDYREYEIMLYARLADETAREIGPYEASRIIEDAISALGADRRLVDARRVYRYNFAADAHNRFAHQYNERRYEEGRKILEAALEKVPESNVLKNDLKTLDRTTNR